MTEKSVAGRTMSTFRCWSAEQVAQTVFSDIGQLAGHADALFLAAHSPMDLEHRKGRELKLASTGEARVLEALTSRIGDVERNTLVAVTGGSGSGKSHVVRWVHAHLPPNDPRFKVLYVPRAVQTLRELLRKIIEGLPGVEGADLMSRVDSAFTGVKPGMLQERLVSEMKIALNWTIEDRGAYDGETSKDAEAREDRNSMLGERNENGGRVDGLADLLDRPAFKASLLRSDGPLSVLVQSYFTETSRRDDNDQIFSADDLPLRERGILTELRERRELQDLWRIITRHPQDAIDLLEEALRVALPKAVGLRDSGGDTLDSLFRASRQALRIQGQELVLIFEDLAQFGLVDGELYDQFVTPPGEDLAPLRVIFAVTDDPYARMERTVRTRVEHEFHVAGFELAHTPQFVGRYLNLVRVGRDETQRLWKSTADRNAADWMVNACDTREEGLPCRFRDDCHAAFGSVSVEGLGDVGLYPYNAEALERALARLGESSSPRKVLDVCITTILDEADVHIGNRSYPHDRTREQFDFKIRMGKDALLARNPSSDPERAYRALVIWGNESPLPAGVLDAFTLGGTPAKTEPLPPVPDPPGPVKPDLENRLAQLFQWQVGDDLPAEEADTLRVALYDLTFDRLQLDQARVHVFAGRGKAVLDSLFNMTSFAIEGARGRPAGMQSVRFELTRKVEDMRVMAAARWFREHGHFDPARGKWQWPEGYDAGQLMVELETRLDEWAAEVRKRFLDVTGGSRLARHAVGIRAVALAASGRSVEGLDNVAAVLAAPAQSLIGASAAWTTVDDIASEILSKVRADEYVGEFAAVRQGDGGPQLVDPRELDDAIAQFLAGPVACLEDLAASRADPVLAQAAQRLRDAMVAAAAAEAESVTAAIETTTRLLEGQDPAIVGAYAFNIADSAKDEGFFRPREQWAHFRRHIEYIEAFRPVDAPAVGDGDIGEELRGQHAARQITQLAEALTFVNDAMELTRKECERSGRAGDVSLLRRQVSGQINELTVLTNSLGQGGKS